MSRSLLPTNMGSLADYQKSNPKPLAYSLTLGMRPGAVSSWVMPFLVGVVTTSVLFYGLKDTAVTPSYALSPQAQFDVSGDVSARGLPYQNVTGRDELFEELWAKNKGVVWMSKAEVQMVVKYLKPEHTMYEWGSGGSTTFFSHFVSRYYSVENNEKWSSTVQERIAAESELPNKVVYRYIPSVPYRRIWPGPPSEGANFAEYIGSVPEDLLVDRFFVDGRVRPQCAIEALFHFRNSDDAILFIHDFWDTQQRPHYKLALLFYEMIDTVLEGQSLIVLRPKPDWRERLANFKYPDWWVGQTADGSEMSVELIHQV